MPQQPARGGDDVWRSTLSGAVLSGRPTLIDGMQERGLVSRAGTRGRGRANPVRLTAQGKALLDAAWGPVMDTNNVTGLPPTP